jgi:hypothetical protein
MSTSPAQAKRIVVVGVLGTGAVAAVDQLRKGNVPSVKIGVGVLISGSMLLALSEVAPAIAAGFAALVLVTSVFVLGGGTWSAVARITQ